VLRRRSDRLRRERDALVARARYLAGFNRLLVSDARRHSEAIRAIQRRLR
jgi:hypothetical protein